MEHNRAHNLRVQQEKGQDRKYMIRIAPAHHVVQREENLHKKSPWYKTLQQPNERLSDFPTAIIYTKHMTTHESHPSFCEYTCFLDHRTISFTNREQSNLNWYLHY